MSETITTSNTAQRAGVIAHALRSLADHIEAHHLDGLGDINIEDTHLELAITQYDARVWQASLRDGVDEVLQRPAAPGQPLEFVTLRGRLPETGVRVELTWLQHTPAVRDFVQAVTQ